MELTFTNKAMQAMTGFAIQFNKNRYGIIGALSMALTLCLQDVGPNLGPNLSTL